MRPCRSTSVISATTRPAPELASMPRWVRCQSEATPSLALYWHMGDTTMRLASARSASLIGEKSALMFVWRLLGDLFGDDVGVRWARDHRDRRHRQTSLKQAQSDRAP